MEFASQGRHELTTSLGREAEYLHVLTCIANENSTVDAHTYAVHNAELSIRAAFHFRAKHGDERAVRFEHLHTVVAEIANNHIACAVQCDTSGVFELSVC